MKYAAPKGTEVSTIVGGEEFRFVFDKGTYSTDDPALIAVLDACAANPSHPIGYAPDSPDKE